MSTQTLTPITPTDTDGVLAFQAEHTLSPLGNWKMVSIGHPDYFEGASNDSMLYFTGNQPSHGPADSPLAYTFIAPESGTYELTIRSSRDLRGAANDHCNDFFVRMAGDFEPGPNTFSKSVLTSNTKHYFSSVPDRQWGWTRLGERRIGGENVKLRFRYVLKQGEVYTLTVSGRSQRAIMDYILLFNTSKVTVQQASAAKLIMESPVDGSLIIIFDENQGTVSKSPDKPVYDHGEEVVLTAVPEPGFIFERWGGDVFSTQNPLTVTINSHMDITASFTKAGDLPVGEKLIHFDEVLLEAVKKQIEQNNAFFVHAYNSLISDANKELNKAANPVTNKTQVPPSGSKNDYLSLAPYWWPNPDTPDGLPWINRDGQVNPLTRGDNTDQVRLSNFFTSIELLSFAYYFSNDIRYANKAIDLINIWFVDSATRVNPNVNYGQGIPGINNGRPIGIIEWSSFSNVITALQILNNKGVLPAESRTAMHDWISEFSHWMRTSSFGIAEGNMGNNHGTYYDFQVLGLLLYTGETADANDLVNEYKTRRIEHQIQPNGSQPSELSRTKSVNYSTMNLRAMTRIAQIGWQVGIDLWSYESADGRSIRKAYEFLLPYVLGEQTWTWTQISNGGAVNALNTLTKPLFSIAGTIFREDLIPQSENAGNGLSYLDRLKYPPRERLFIEEAGKAYIFINVNPNQGLVNKSPDQLTYEPGEDVVLSAVPNTGFRFVNWTGDITSDENPLTIKLDSTIYITANFEQASGIDEKNIGIFKVYPNPSKGVFTVEIDHKASYNVYNLSGVRIKKGTEHSTFHLHMNGFPKGMYLLEIITHEGITIERLVLE